MMQAEDASARQVATFLAKLRTVDLDSTEPSGAYLARAVQLLVRLANLEENRVDNSDGTKILRGYSKGDVVFIECDRQYTAEQYKQISEAMNLGLARKGVTAVVLHHGLRVVAREETQA